MSDPDLFRGRLTGVIVEDSTDPAPGGERIAIVTFQKEDSGTGTSTLQLGKAKVLLPNGAPCPVYAAAFHLFGLVHGPTSLPLPLDQQPLVLVRRDTSNSGGTTGCYTITISPTLVARAVQKWAGSGHEPAHLNDFVELKFYDGSDLTASTKLGYFMNFGGVANLDVIQPDSLVSVSIRTDVTPVLPTGYHHAWLVAPLNQGNTCPCKITSGTGASYVADFYANGLSVATETGVAVTQLQIDGGETIPANTWAIATRIHQVWYVQVPVWLA